MKTLKDTANDIVAWLKNYAETNNRKAFVIGISGGVDSALVSTLCAMTGLPTHCVILPCNTKVEENMRGDKHIDWLMDNYANVVYYCVDLTKTFETFAYECRYEFDNDLGYANTKSRLRMIALYQIATCKGGLVVGTGNKIEDAGIGFCTKHGDNGIDLSPISDLTKTEVRKMCRDLGVLPELSEAIPTDGLWADARTDESQLGASYEELEFAMDFRERTKDFGGKYYLSDRQLEVLSIYDKWHTATRHKFDPIPCFIRK